MFELSDIFTTKASSIEQKIYTKSSMIAISHGLEDMIIEFGLKAELFVAFQKFEFFMVEIERYKALEKVCSKLYIFAQNIDFEAVRNFKNTVFVELDKKDLMTQEWNIIINHPEHPAVFVTKEIVYSEPVKEDQFRRFGGFLSFSGAIMAETLKVIKNKLNKYGVEYKLPDTTYERAQLEIVTRKMGFFINRTLGEIEDKTSQLVNKTSLLETALNENGQLTNEIIKRLCYAAEYKDEDSALHMVRMSLYSSILYEALGQSEEKVRQINYAALMHDIGKIGIPDSILLKPGKLTASEYEVMKTHTVIGSRILEGSQKDIIKMGYEIAKNHHEKYDGTGYPSGLSGRDIPLSARVVAISDVFDALSTKRVYKEAFPVETCIDMIKEQRNKHFDGELVDLFISKIDIILEQKKAIDLRFSKVKNEDIFSVIFSNTL